MSASLVLSKTTTVSLHSITDVIAIHWALVGLALFVLYVLYEQIAYHWRKGSLPGPSWVAPFVGGIVTMVQDPVTFWHGQSHYGNLSWNALIGKLLIFSHGAGTSRKILENSSADMPLWLHPNAVTLLGRDNMAFINGPSHKALRARLLPLFTPKALGLYLQIQEKAIREFFAKWIEESRTNPQGIVMQDRVWMLNANTSLSVFIGTYLEGKPELRDSIIRNYRKVTEGFLAFPINLPGTLLHTGLQGRKVLINLLVEVVGRCRQRMRTGAEPGCLLDFWMQTADKELDDAVSAGKPVPEHTSDHDMAKIMFDFLFAAQDASTASICWTIHLVGTNPEVLRRVREEQQTVRPGNTPLTTDLVQNQLPYTYSVMREVLRYRPPATMVPHHAKKPFKLTDDFTVPAGSLVIPFIFGGTHQGYEDPETFDPDRFSPERAEDKKFDKNFLTFGAGPHACMGYRYAMNHIMCFLSILASEIDYKRKITPNMDKIRYYSTIYPDDAVVLDYFRSRTASSV